METVYNLSFTIGNVQCSLVSATPYQRFSQLSTAHYEHCHHYFEIHAVWQGTCAFLCGNTTVTVRKSELLLLPPNIYHKLISVEDSCVKLCLSFRLTRQDTPKNDDSNNFYEVFSKNRHPAVIPQSHPIKEKLDQINQLLSGPGSFLSREMLKVECNSFLLYLFTLLDAGKEKEAEKVYDTTPTNEYIIDNFFARNFKSNSAKEQLAEQLHVSPRQLQRILMEKYGKNYREKMTEIRVIVATGFLQNSSKSIAEISEIMGYGTPSNFATFLKKATGKTPGQIRRDKIREKSGTIG